MKQNFQNIKPQKKIKLNDLHEVEKEFHDRKVVEGPRKNVYSLSILDRRTDRYTYHLLGNLQDKVVLDLGCGGGHHTVRFAERGATVYAIDLSAGMVENARKAVKEHGLSERVKVLQMEAEKLQFADETFDLVVGYAILHHTRLELTRAEVHRVLKKGGRGVFTEPLGHNPFSNLFRKLTPEHRTPTENPLRMEDVIFFGEPFSTLRHREFYLLALAAVFLLPFKSKRVFQKILNWLLLVDDFLFTYWPTLGRYARIVVFEVVK